MERAYKQVIVADLNRTLPGWFGYFKYVKASQLGEIDGWASTPATNSAFRIR